MTKGVKTQRPCMYRAGASREPLKGERERERELQEADKRDLKPVGEMLKGITLLCGSSARESIANSWRQGYSSVTFERMDDYESVLHSFCQKPGRAYFFVLFLTIVCKVKSLPIPAASGHGNGDQLGLFHTRDFFRQTG